MTELQMIRGIIPLQYKRVQDSVIEYKRCSDKKNYNKKEKYLKELFRLIEEEINLSCTFNCRKNIHSIK
jgi:hypothetical protein